MCPGYSIITRMKQETFEKETFLQSNAKPVREESPERINTC